MPRISFSGFNDGTFVALSAGLGGETASGSVSPWGQNVASVGINATHSTEQVTPFSVVLEASGHDGFDKNGPENGEVFDPTHAGIFYIWRVRGPQLSGFTNQALNIPNEWRDRNVMYGPKVGFVFDTAGQHTVDLWCIELSSGKIAEQSWSIQVYDTAAYHAGGATAVFDADGSFAGKPSDATELTTTPALINFLESASGSVRVLFPRGKTSALTERILHETGATHVQFGAYGTGDDPVVTLENASEFYRFTGTRASAPTITFSNLVLRGKWRADREAGRPQTAFAWNSPQTDARVLFHQCEISGAVGGFTIILSGTLFLHDTYWHDWGGTAEATGYGCYVGGGADVVVVGCAGHQNPDACLGSMNGPFENYGGAFRVAVGTRTIVAASSFFSNTGWSGAGNISAAQAAMRLNTSATSSFSGNIDRVVAEGGFTVVDGIEDPGSTILTAQPANFVCDKFLCVASATSNRQIDWNQGGTWRNVICVTPGCTDWTTPPSDGQFEAITLDIPDQIVPDLLDQPLEFYSSTILGLSTNFETNEAEFFENSSGDTFSNVTIENNLIYDLGLPDTSDGPVTNSGSIPGFTPKSIGVRFSVRKPTFTLTASVPDGGTVSVPYPERFYVDPADNTFKTETLANTDFDGTPTESLHAVRWNQNFDVAYASEGSIEVDVSNPAGALITNRTGSTWASGSTIRVNLVPKVSSNPTLEEYETPAFGLPYLASNADGIGKASAPLRAWDDFLGRERAAPVDLGALKL